MMGLQDLQSLFSGGIDANVAPAASGQAGQPIIPTSGQATPDNPFGQVLARLRGAKAPSLPSFGQLPDVRGKDKGSALFTGLSTGMNAGVQDQQNAAAQNLAQMKLQWDHEAAIAKQKHDEAVQAETARHNQATEGQAATNNKTLAEYYKGLNENAAAKLAGKSGDNSANWNALDAKDKSLAAEHMVTESGWNPHPGYQSDEDKARNDQAFQNLRAIYKERTGLDYPIGPDGKPAVLPPPAPKGGPTGIDPNMKISLPGYDAPVTRAEAEKGGNADKWDQAAVKAAVADPSVIGKKAPKAPVSAPAPAVNPAPAPTASPPPPPMTPKPQTPAPAAAPPQQDVTGAAGPPPTPADQWRVIHNPKTNERALYNPVTKETRPFNDAAPNVMQNTQQGAAIGDPAADDPAAGLTQ